MSAYLVGYVVFGALWTIARMRTLLGKQKGREAAVYGATMSISLVIGSLLLVRMKLPSFVLPVQRLLEPIGQFLLRH